MSIPYGVQRNIAEATITGGFSSCDTYYNEPYSHATQSDDVRTVGASTYTHVILGARYGASGQFLLAAVGEYDAVFAATSSTTTAYENNGVYWYFYPSKSIGFASDASVSLNTADTKDSPGSEDRLSWHLDVAAGGYRVGTTKYLNSDTAHYKVVMYCN